MPMRLCRPQRQGMWLAVVVVYPAHGQLLSLKVLARAFVGHTFMCCGLSQFHEMELQRRKAYRTTWSKRDLFEPKGFFRVRRSEGLWLFSVYTRSHTGFPSQAKGERLQVHGKGKIIVTPSIDLSALAGM